jgi:hypothetical protein
VTVSLYAGQTLVGSQTVAAPGGFDFPSVADGSYAVVVSGSGVRTASDIFNLRHGSRIEAKYDLSLSSAAPTNAEAQAAFGQALHLVRGFSGLRSTPLAVQGMIDFSRRYGFVSGAGKAAAATQAQVVAIPLVGVQNIAVDGTGTAWASCNNTISQFPAGPPVSTGVAQISTDAVIRGQISTADQANSGGGVVGVNGALDVAVYNPLLESVGFLPRGQTGLQTRSGIGTNVSVNAIVGQRVPGSTTLQRLVLAGTVQTSPRLAFLDGTGTLTAATLPAGFPSNLVVLGAAVDPSDNSIYLSGHVAAGPQAHLIHLDPTGATLLEDVPLGAFLLFGQQNLTRDSAGNLWMAAGTNLVRVGGTPGSRTVSVLPAVHSDASPFVQADGLAADSSGDVWVADAGSNSVTQFSVNGTAVATLATGASPVSVAVDPVGNVWIACRGSLNHPEEGVVDEVVIGGGVPPNTQTQAYVQPNGSVVTVQPAPTSSSFVHTFPNATYQSTLHTDPVVISQSAQTITSQSTAVVVSGPTRVSQSGQVDSRGNSITQVTSLDAQTGQPVHFSSVWTNTNNQYGGVIEATTEGGATITADYASSTGNTVLLRGTVTDPVGGLSYGIAAVYAADGSLTRFEVDNSASGLSTVTTVSPDGVLSSALFMTAELRANPSAQPIATAGSASSQSILEAFVALLPTPVPPATPLEPSFITQYLTTRVVGSPPYEAGDVPGYDRVTVTNPDGTITVVSVAIATTTVSGDAGDGEVLDGAPSEQTPGGTDASGETTPAGQGTTVVVDTAGSSQGEVGEISGTGGGSTGAEKGGPRR